MGIFDKLKKNKSGEKNNKGTEKVSVELKQENNEAPGWDAITKAFEEIYPGQTNPKHYGTLISWRFGGNDPLDGISVYEGEGYYHFVTYGLSELYEKESENKEISGYGMEFTFKLKKDKYEDEEGEIRCICGILQQLARFTFNNGEIFKPYEYLYTGQTAGIDVAMKSNITGFITVPENKVEEIDTSNGKVTFVEFIGVTDSELNKIMNKEITVKELYQKLGTDITDYNRADVI